MDAAEAEAFFPVLLPIAVDHLQGPLAPKVVINPVKDVVVA